MQFSHPLAVNKISLGATLDRSRAPGWAAWLRLRDRLAVYCALSGIPTAGEIVAFRERASRISSACGSPHVKNARTKLPLPAAKQRESAHPYSLLTQFPAETRSGSRVKNLPVVSSRFRRRRRGANPQARFHCLGTLQNRRSRLPLWHSRRLRRVDCRARFHPHAML